jgi:hypothetical protein
VCTPLDETENDDDDDDDLWKSDFQGGNSGKDKHFAPLDLMPSFWLSETLKYIYLVHTDPAEGLLFLNSLYMNCNIVLPLDQWIFTTEAQPILRRKYVMRTLRRLEKERMKEESDIYE